MADAAVGAVSLALQVSKGLIWYIDGVKDAKNKTAKIIEETQKLGTLLEQIDLIVKGMRRSGAQGAAAAWVIACGEALEAIEEKLGADKDAKGSRYRQRLQEFGRRLLYPFKQDNIKFLKDMLTSTERHLQTALAMLTIEMNEQRDRQIAQLTQLCQASFQALQDQNRLHDERTSQNLARQEKLTSSLAQTVENRTDMVLSGITSTTEHLRPMGARLANISSLFPAMENEISQLNEKLGNITVQEVTPKVIEEDVSNFLTVASDMANFNRAMSKKRYKDRVCTCRGQKSTMVYLEGPLHLSKTQARVHSPDCPYAMWEDGVTNLQLRFEICSISLRRKIHIGLSLSRGGRSSGIFPTLKCDRIVLKSAPAFRLLANFQQRLGQDPNFDAWEKPAKELLRLFELRKATPHDRLPNGMTLLHYFCYTMPKFFVDDVESLVTNYYAMGKRILEFMPTQALEKDSEGLTCVDYSAVGIHSTLVEHFLEHGVPIAIWARMSGTNWLSDFGLQFPLRPHITLDCSESMLAILLQSEDGLIESLRCGSSALSSQNSTQSLFETATQRGWRRGCEILLEHGVEVTTTEQERSLLQSAISCRHEDVVRFWLEAREGLNDSALQHIGSLEQAVVDVATSRGSTQPQWVDLLMSALVRQRQQLQSLASKHGIVFKTDRLLDAQASTIISALEGRGVIVKPSLKPTKRSVYHTRRIGGSVEALEALYKAGFRDIAPKDFTRNGPPSVSPLLHQFTSANGENLPKAILRMVPWFLSHGAKLTETWPGSDTATIHCLGWRVGNNIYGLPTIAQLAVEDFACYFADQTLDKCQCPCSTSGCLFVTSFCKGLTIPSGNISYWTPEEADAEWRFVRRSWRDRLQLMEAFISQIASRQKNRWLVSEFIRLAIFTELGIRHTCCDMASIMLQERHNYSIAPTPKYNKDELSQIQEEDRHLVSLLEDLVKKFDEIFDKSIEDVETFFELTLVPEMDRELERLRDEDRERYTEGRLKIGVVMDSADEEDDIDDYESCEKADSDAESFDESFLEM